MKDNWENKDETLRCATCMWFVPKKGTTLGRCRKHAPTLDGWPTVYSNDWCGDHKMDETKLINYVKGVSDGK